MAVWQQMLPNDYIEKVEDNMNEGLKRVGTLLIVVGVFILLIGVIAAQSLFSTTLERNDGAIKGGIFFIVLAVGVIWLGVYTRNKGKREKRFTDLTAGDFPEVDSTKFYEWFYAQKEAIKGVYALMGTSLLGLIALLVFPFPMRFIIWALLLIGGFAYFLSFISKAGRLKKEAGIDRQAIKRALENIPKE